MSDVYELATSRKFSYGDGKPSAERQFIVTDAADESVVATLFGSSLPEKYDHYPNDSGLPFELVAFDYQIVKEPNAVATWRVSMQYRGIRYNTGPTNPTTSNISPDEVGYRTARLSMTASFVDGYREFNSVAQMQSATGSSASDIGGTSVDVGGIPLSILAYKQEFSILITDQFLPNSQAIAAQIGTRNDSTFLNYAAGSVLFAGCNAETVPEVGHNSIEYRFIFDQAFHAIQYPVRANNGSPILANAASGGIAKGSAATVFYNQPYKYTSNFSLLSQYFGGL